MKPIPSFNYLDQRFDDQLHVIESLKWLPWVGDKYNDSTNNKLLVIGESCYQWNGKEAPERLAQKSFTREMIEFDDAINQKSTIRFYRNFERAFFNKRKPSAEASKELWRSVCFHNLVLKPMPNKHKRPSMNDYIEGWKTLLNMSEILKPNYCIFAGTDSKKIDAFFEAIECLSFKTTTTLNPVKLGRSRGRKFVVESPSGSFFSIVFIKHPSAFFSWELWGEFLNEHIPSISAINQNLHPASIGINSVAAHNSIQPMQ